MRVHRDAGRDAQPYRLRLDTFSDKRTQALDVVRTVDHDASDARAQRTSELLVGLRVPVQLHAGGRKPGAARGEQLPKRCDAGVQPRARYDRADADERTSLDRIRDAHGPVRKERIDISADARAYRLGVVDVERRPVAVRELDDIRSRDRKAAIAADGRSERPDRAIDLYELCGGSSGRDSMNSLNTASS